MVKSNPTSSSPSSHADYTDSFDPFSPIGHRLLLSAELMKILMVG